MKRTVLFAALIVTLMAIAVIAQEAITVNRAVVCANVVDREPAGADSVFADSASTLCCFTELDGAVGQVVHAWYHGDKMRFEITLNKGREGRWRTWSRKNMIKDWAGAWRVEVKDVDGNVLKSVNFRFGK